MVKAASGLESPVSVDMAFKDIFEVIQEIEDMPNNAQIVPERDDCPSVFSKVDNNAENYANNMTTIKLETKVQVPCPFSDTPSEYSISDWTRISLQFDKSRGFPLMPSYPAEESAEKLINETKNLFQYPSIPRELLNDNYSNYFAEQHESHIVPELDKDWLDSPLTSEEFFNRFEQEELSLMKKHDDPYLPKFSNESESFDSKKTDLDLFESTDILGDSRQEMPLKWFITDRPIAPATKNTTEGSLKKEAKKSKSSFKSTGRPRLCQFLLELLDNPDKYANLIEWLDKEKGVFKFLNSSRVAQEWGTRRNKPRMKYENFARSLRTYIAKGILTKPRSKLVYRFTSVS